MFRARRRVRARSVQCGLATGVVLLTCAADAHADIYIWNGGDGWFWEPSNWMPPGPPGSLDTALFNTEGGDVWFDTEPMTHQLYINDADVVFTGLPWFRYDVMTQVVVAPDAGQNGSLTIRHGRLFADEITIADDGTAALAIRDDGHVDCRDANIGSDSGSDGTLGVEGASSSFNASSYLIVGSEGTAQLNATEGALVGCFGSSIMGLDIGGLGSSQATITGPGSSWYTVGWLHVGFFGAATLGVSAGGYVFCEAGVVANMEDTTATVTVDGVGSTWDVETDLIIGRWGSGDLIIQNGAEVLSTTSTVGAMEPSDGFVGVDGGGSLWAALAELHIGEYGSGALSVTNGGYVSNTAGSMASFPDSSAVVSVDGVASTWVNSISLTVGGYGTASLTVSNGGTVAAPLISIGQTGEVHGHGGLLYGNVVNDGVVNPGGVSGELTIEGDYEQTASGVLDIELDDTADLLIVYGQATLAGALNLSLADGFIPELGEPYPILAADSIVGSFDVSTCPAQFTIDTSQPGVISVIVETVDPPADCDEVAWTNESGGDFDDPLNWTGGVPPQPLTTAVFDGIADQTFSVYDVFFPTDAVTDRLIVRSNRLVQFKLNDRNYEVRGLAAPDLPSIVIGDVPGRSAELSLRNLAPPNVYHGVRGSTTTIAEEPGSIGTLTVTDPFTLFESTDLYVGRRGDGVFEIFNGASADATGDVSVGTEADAVGAVAVSGAEWTTTGGGIVIGASGDGTLTISDGGQLVSSSQAPVVLAQEPGSTAQVTVTGAGSSWVEEVATALVAGNGDATVTVTDGGVIQFPTMSIHAGGELRGDGALVGDLINVGVIRPGASSGPSTTGVLTIDGNYSQVGIPAGGESEHSGSLIVEVGAAGHDQLVVSGGVAELGGGLFVELTEGPEPELGQAFDVLDATTITDGFDVAFFPGLAEGRFLRVDYGPGLRADAAIIIVENLDTIFDFDNTTPEGVNAPPTGVVVGDFDLQNGDDLAICTTSPGSVLVLLNAGVDGSGNWLGFAASGQTFVGNDLSGIAAGFLDADPQLDVAVTNRDGDEVFVLLNTGNGDGMFSVRPAVAVGSQPSALAATDLDGDGITDLAVANGGSDDVHILVNDGNGNVGFDQVIPVGAFPLAVVPSDLDEDKDPDALVTANHGTDDISLIPILGGGVFGTVVNLDVGDGPVDLATDDLDGDGRNDLVTANAGDVPGDAGTVSVVLNNGDGTFAPAVNLPVGDDPGSLTTIDLEGDLDSDVAVVVGNDLGERVVQVLRNDLASGQLNFADAAEVAAGENPVLVTAGDLDADAHDDLITLNESLGGAASGRGLDRASALVRLGDPCKWDCGAPADEQVGVVDFLALLAQWAAVGESCDFDGGGVGVTDFLELLAHWGPCP
jgi:T5SS/PEP-CTERM-associated repeat protein